MDKHIIYGVHITDRLHHVSQVQKVLSEYGCHIKTRLGLHEVSETICAASGVLILEMFGDEGKCDEMLSKINGIEGVEAQSMIFDHS